MNQKALVSIVLTVIVITIIAIASYFMLRQNVTQLTPMPIPTIPKDETVLFRVMASDIGLQSRWLARGKQLTDFIEVTLPGKLYNPPLRVTAIARGLAQASWGTPIDAVTSDFSAWKTNDKEWILKNFIDEEQDEVISFLNEFGEQNMKLFKNKAWRSISGEVFYNDYKLVLIKDDGEEQGEVTSNSSPQVIVLKHTPEGWKRTNALSKDETFDIVWSAWRSGEVRVTQFGQIPPDTFTVTAYALEKDGGHIFDGANIAAIDKVSGKILSEQMADQNGKVIFYLKPGIYRFQPSPLKENRVVGFLDVDIQNNQELILRLTEIGPTAFGAPVQTCDAKKDAINLALETANYCETDSDCKLFQPVGFSCWTYIHKSFNTSTVVQRITDYGKSCDLIPYNCAAVGQALCIQGKCKVDYK